jgi:voltage-gated potassium channel
MGSTGTQDVPFLLRRLLGLLGLLVVLVAAGTVGYSRTEHITGWKGFVWTIDTVATVGGTQAARTTGGEVITVALILLGVGTLLYGLVTVTELVVAGHLSGLVRERRERKTIEGLADHYIICGFGRVGRQIARDLRAADARYVVVDTNPRSRELAQGVNVRFIEGEPADDSVLRSAGIERAKAVVAAVDSDAQNVFITLSARQLCPSIFIVARASQEDTEPKLKQAGADRVISPYKASGSEMARIALHPQVAGAFDVTADFRMEEIEVTPGCQGAGRALGDIRGGSIVVAVRRSDGQLVPQPPSDTVVEPGDILVALGTPRTLDRLEGLFQPAKAPAS